ncbi:hypothetical protein [Umezawaea tangerina]|uniref:hypothetical protein n=1 Tax=Umezawaea tangerina TaxID=84725 RepID=UPI001475095A|nr:hypothetical protein [Umezawaea tangerina]
MPQVVGAGMVAGRGGVVVVVAVVVGVLLVVRAHVVLVDPVGGVVAGTGLRVRSRTRAVRGASLGLCRAFAAVDGEWLRWEMGPGPTAVDLVGGAVPLREVTGVWVAEAVGVPAGPVVVVRTVRGWAQVLVGDPVGFAALVDRRLRMVAGIG